MPLPWSVRPYGRRRTHRRVVDHDLRGLSRLPREEAGGYEACRRYVDVPGADGAHDSARVLVALDPGERVVGSAARLRITTPCRRSIASTAWPSGSSEGMVKVLTAALAQELNPRL